LYFSLVALFLIGVKRFYVKQSPALIFSDNSQETPVVASELQLFPGRAAP
jgi:hypothetical protein